jgi:hypothetical protein
MVRDMEQQARRDRPEPTDEEFRPRIGRSSQALGGISDDELPHLRTFASVPLKEGADQLLVTDHLGDRAPILAAWQVGLGRTAVFTADPSLDWQSWGQVRRFWSQLVRWLARPESGDEIRLALRSEGERTVLAVDTYDSAGAGQVLVQLNRLDGTPEELLMTSLGPRHYEVTLPPPAGIERRVVIKKQIGREAVFSREEWLPEAKAQRELGGEDPEAEPNWALLSQIAEITGGAVNPPLGTLLTRAPADRQASTPLDHPLAIAALVLALGDIALRLVALRSRV